MADKNISKPSGDGDKLPSYRPDSRPQNLPAKKPENIQKPSNRPGNGDNPLGLHPSERPNIPDRGGNLADKRPNVPDRGGDLADKRPNIPDRGGNLADKRPNVPERPQTLPARVNDHPNLAARRPSVPDAPGRPQRSQRPEWNQQSRDLENRFTDNEVNWAKQNNVTVNNFQNNRSNQWNSINRWNQPGWARQWGTPGYNGWRRDVWGFRGNRCGELWYRTAGLGYYNSFFNSSWFGGCRWYPPGFSVGLNVSPWWWWRPLAWTGIGAFFGSVLAPQPVVYDPGTTVIYEGDKYYVDGKDSGSATAARSQAITLANPPLASVPVPVPSDAGTSPEQEQWLPAGVWGITQQEQGDAVMFMQLSVDKNGLVSGAYKNVMTGDEQPITGQVDFKTQRMAWHVGDATSTVYETGLSNLANDVASVFVHFGEAQTQTWLMVRMPSPEMPPGAVKLPEIAAN